MVLKGPSAPEIQRAAHQRVACELRAADVQEAVDETRV